MARENARLVGDQSAMQESALRRDSAQLLGAQRAAIAESGTEIAAEDPAAFHDAQHKFIDRTHYRVQIKKIQDEEGLGIGRRSYALQDVVWSTAVQHGPDTGIVTTAIQEARRDFGDDFTDEQLIGKVYDVRSRWNPIDKPRYDEERLAALRQLKHEVVKFPPRKQDSR